ncbi:MAG: ribosome-associated translation inhibitor RaiA [Gammaproteobacteria bacterium]|nr:ribosome-associated translation inhibitor RaiA [Gammaproteobacteria bacterium]
MHITYTGHHVEVTPALRAYAEGKLNKLTHHSEHITSLHVVFSLEKLVQIAEATVSVAKAEVHARAESADMYSAIDLLVDKLDRQLVKYKEKRQNHRDHDGTKGSDE